MDAVRKVVLMLLVMTALCVSSFAEPGCQDLNAFGQHAGQPAPIHATHRQDQPAIRFDWGSEAWYERLGRWMIRDFVANRNESQGLIIDWEKGNIFQTIFNPLPS